jgi:hypothetical protein
MEENKLLSIEDFEKDWVPCDIIERVQREINESEYPFSAGHESYLRRARDWNELADQVVGSGNY